MAHGTTGAAPAATTLTAEQQAILDAIKAQGAKTRTHATLAIMIGFALISNEIWKDPLRTLGLVVLGVVIFWFITVPLAWIYRKIRGRFH